MAQMNSKKIRQTVKNRGLESNIKMKPQNQSFNAPKSSVTKSSKMNVSYYLSWGAVAVLSIAGVSAVVLNEGGVKDAIRTAGFNKINRQIAENKFSNSNGADNIPTASIPKTITGTNRVQGTRVVVVPTSRKVATTQAIPLASQPVVTIQKQPIVISTPTRSTKLPQSKELGQNNAAIGTTYFSVFLGQSSGKANIISLWYSIKSQNEALFAPHQAAYYYDAKLKSYNLVVGKFTNLGQSLKYCAELKFNDIACKYDSKFANLQTTSID